MFATLLNWFQRPLALGWLAYLAILEVLSWATSSWPSGPCLVSQEQPCPTFFFGLLILLRRVDAFIGHHDKSIVAVFTVVLALSTIALWRSSEKMWQVTKVAAVAAKAAADHIPKVERAYLSGGGGGGIVTSHAAGTAPDGSGTSVVMFRFDVNNFGKTPGELREIKYGFLPMPADETTFHPPIPPQYSETFFWQDWYQPGVQSKSVPQLVTLPVVLPAIIFGRLYYYDIFDAGHSSGFILKMAPNGGTSPIKAPTSYTEERDEPSVTG
jgi:hypothetical protein